MEYYKQEGSHWTTFYRLNDKVDEMIVLELRYSNPSNHNLEGVFSTTYSSPEEFTETNVAIIRRYEPVTKKEFVKAQKEASDWIRKQGE